ncbi:hypothetical protein [Sphingomonas sp. PAMC 26617]|uniref:hypothetical protein n=1 Tax=Sphingomonas sp. PAMC 26617 TaxID=1112216 RepID=UPI0002D2D72C|nr:hypothetical protein [Sphingomonas sp. PAMC 26617]
MILLLAIAMSVAVPPLPERPEQARHSTVTETYRVRYAGRRDEYCLRVFADPAPAEPYPRSAADPCRSRADWAKDGIAISDPYRDRSVAMQR